MSPRFGLAAGPASPLHAARVARRLDDVELSPIKEIELRASRIEGVVSLAQGIPSFDTPEPIKRFVAERMAEGLCARYSVTPGLPQLREAIGETLRGEGMSYDAESEILVTVGSIEAIAAALLATIDPGEEVLLLSPSYASYVPAIQIAGGVPRFVPLNEDANFDLDPDAIEEAVSRRTRVLLLCNPNNPTGTVFSRQQTLRMLRVAEQHDLLVISDEVYKDFLYGDVQWFSAAMEVSARHRVLRVCSFSKAYGMTGWRVGFLHGPAALVGEILKVHDALVTCAPVISQYAALAALDLGAAAIEEFRAEFRRRRDHVIERLDALPQVFDYQKPNASYFVFPRIKDTIAGARDSRWLANELLDRARVALVPGVAFGPSGESHLRFCYARSPDDIDLAFDRLDDYFSGRRPRTSLPSDASEVRAAPTPAPIHKRLGILALRRLARARLARQQPKIVAITGTQGKTVMKRTLQELLRHRFRVHANPLSYNTDIGLALGILDVNLDTTGPTGILRGFVHAAWAAWFDPSRVDVMVLELGIRRAGDMRAHLEVVHPDVVVVTPLAPNFGHGGDDLTQLHKEVEDLCRAAKRPDRETILLSADDSVLSGLAAREAQATFSSKQIQIDAGGGQIMHAAGRTWTVLRDTVGDSSRRALVAAVSVGRMLGMRDAEIEAFLREGRPGGERALAPTLTAS